MERSSRIKPLDLEKLVGGRVLLGVGALAFLIGVSFFLKYAFDNHWIGPAGRVEMGLGAGLVMLALSEFIARRGQRLYAEVLAALAAGVLYVSLWAAGTYFHLVPTVWTFGAMAVVTASVMAIAWRRDSQRLALFALIGGLLTPLLNETRDTTLLFSYLAVLNTALLWLGKRRWPTLELTAFAGSEVYLIANLPYQMQLGAPLTFQQAVVAAFAVILLLQVTFGPILRARRAGVFTEIETLVFCLASALCYVSLCQEFYLNERNLLSALTASLAAIYLGSASLLRGGPRKLAATVALSLITIGVGITFHANSMSAVWAAEAATLMAIGLTFDSRLVRAFGYISYVCAIVALLAGVPGGAPFVNARFVTLIALAVASAVAAFAASNRYGESREFEIVTKAGEIAAHVFFLVGFGNDLFAFSPNPQLALSLMMLVYATALVAAGFIYKRQFARWEGLVLFIALIAKVFLVDLATVQAVVRIGSFLALGSALLGTAWVYQRAQLGNAPES